MTQTKKKDDCFIIMPIGSCPDYDNDHFLHVYKNIIKPACEKSGLKPIRADDVKETNLIHLDILRKLIDSPIAICDLSTRNPNVLFELGIRQAFDKPVVLIQEKGTEKIFDIAPLRYLEYEKEMKYHDVLLSQQELEKSIKATISAGQEAGNVNSIVKLLALSSPASIPNLEGNSKENFALDVMQSQLRDMKHMMEEFTVQGRNNKKITVGIIEYERISKKVESITNRKQIGSEEKYHLLKGLEREVDELSMIASGEQEHIMYRNLKNRIRRIMENVI